jgi:uncharacterized protein (DUF433 family)
MATIIDRGRGPEIEGTWFTVDDILEYSKEGWTARAIASQLRLSSAQVQGALDYVEALEKDVMSPSSFASLVLRRVTESPRPVWLHAIGLTLIFIMYGIAFFLPAADFGSFSVPGFEAFWACLSPSSALQLGLASDRWRLHFGWMPNPMFWAGVCFLAAGRPQLALPLGMFALYVGVAIWWSDRCLIGYFMWLTSFGLLTAISFAEVMRIAIRHYRTVAH